MDLLYLSACMGYSIMEHLYQLIWMNNRSDRKPYTMLTDPLGPAFPTSIVVFYRGTDRIVKSILEITEKGAWYTNHKNIKKETRYN